MASTPLMATKKTNNDKEKQAIIESTADISSGVDIPNKSKKTRMVLYLVGIILIAVAIILIVYFVVIESNNNNSNKQQINLWPMVAMTRQQYPEVCDIAYNELIATNSSLSAIVAGAALCEEVCRTVGWGENPDSNGEVTLDAMIIYGPTRKAGCVGQLRNIKNAMGVARQILIYTKHTLLVGESATEFAIEMGFEYESLSSNQSDQDHQNWIDNNCQSNFWQNMVNVTNKCGPYTKIEITDKEFEEQENELLVTNNMDIYEDLVDDNNHDTVSFVAIDPFGIMSVGTTTNGLNHKIHGRVGDSPIPGGGSYVIQGVGGCGATGNGDIMVRFLPSYKAVQHMENGKTPYEAIQLAMEEIRSIHSSFSGNMICVSADGSHASGSSNPNIAKEYLVRTYEMDESQLMTCESNGNCYQVVETA